MLKVGGNLGDLNVSSIGIATFGASENEDVDRGFKHGINFIDT